MKVETKLNSKPDVVLTLTWDEAVALGQFVSDYTSGDGENEVDGQSIDVTIHGKLLQLEVI